MCAQKLSDDSITIHRLASRDEFEEFARLPMAIFSNADAWWPPDVQSEIELLTHRSPFSRHLEIQPLCAWRGGAMVARVSAVVNRRYIEHWNEPLGQLIHFDAKEN